MAQSAKTLFFCKQCGGESAKWFGRCPHCGEWNSLVEAPKAPKRSAGRRPRRGRPAEAPTRLGETETGTVQRIDIGIAEFDRALGGGLVPGSVVLLGGDPGVGKSTLALQAAGRLAASGRRVLYVTGEESQSQVRLRSDRLEDPSDDVLLLAEGNVSRITECAEEEPPALLVVDSIQTAFTPEADGAPGSLIQVRESGQRLHALAKERNVAVLLIGHVTKEGAIAGPRVLEHMVDTVLYLEGERIGNYRVLRAVKNRFGSTDEIGLFEMRETGLTEVHDPSRMLLDTDGRRAAGSAVVPVIEGTRPLLLEVQALVTPAAYGVAQRVASGIDPKRLAVLLAVLRKHAGTDVSGHDVFVNVVSGIRIQEPAADLGLLAAVVSSFRDRPLPARVALFGEVGLGGEIRPVGQPERRIAEASRVGFERFVVPEASRRDLPKRLQEVAIGVDRLSEALVQAGLYPNASSATDAVLDDFPGELQDEPPDDLPDDLRDDWGLA